MHITIPKEKIDRIEIVKTNCKLTLAEVVKKYKCDYCINGGLYNMKTGRVNAIPLRIDGQTIGKSTNGYWMMAWDKGPDICMDHSRNINNWDNAVACAAMLKDGANTIFNFTAAQGGVRGRTGFGTDADNVHLFVTTDTKGPLSPYALRDKMKAKGCKDAIMLDCGGSSQMYALGKYYQAEKRMVCYWICIWLKRMKDSECPYAEPRTTIRMGSVGTGVKWVQWHLGIATDGIFGSGTKKAVIAFQQKHDLDDDGIVGALTRAKMKET